MNTLPSVSTKRIVTSFGWVAFSNTFNRIFSFGTTLILAKLLTPEHFGLVAAAETMIAILKIFRDLGIGQAIIFIRRDDAITQDTAFTMTLLLAPVLFVVASVGAPFMAAFLEEPSLTPVLIIMATNIIALTMRSVPEALFKREVQFEKLVVPDAVGVIVASVVGIVLAFSGFGVWALVIRTLVFYWLSTLLLWKVSTFRPKLRLDRDVALELFHYSKFVVGAAVLFMGLYNVDRMFVSKMEGIAMLGVYTLAFGLANMPVSEFGHLVCRVVFPVFSKVKDDSEQLRAFLVKAITVEGLVTIPMAIGLMIYGPMLCGQIFGDEWTGLGEALRVLALAALARSISIVFHEFLRGLGNPKLVQNMVGMRLLLLCLGGYPALSLGGLQGFCWLLVGIWGFALMVEMILIYRSVTVSIAELIMPLLVALAVSVAAIGGSFIGLLWWLQNPSLLATLVFVSFTAALYFMVMWMIARDRVRELMVQLKG